MDAIPIWEELGSGCGVYVSPQCRLTTDTLLLAWFSQPKERECCCDLGTGHGAIPILWRQRGCGGPILGVEIDPTVGRLAQLSVERNGFSDTVSIRIGDASHPKEILPREHFDLFGCNPPYYPQGTGKTAAGYRGLARHEGTLTLDTLAQAAQWSLKWGGRLCVCLPVGRLSQAMSVFSAAGLEPKTLLPVQSTPFKDPYLGLLECRRGGRVGLTMKRNLILTDPLGQPTPMLLEAYGSYQNKKGG